jgi:AraC-like DNA-binding protein
MVADIGAAPTFLELAAGAEHQARGNPVGAMPQRAGLTRRTFTRRPRAATGHLPMDCVHALRLVKAKRVIEQDAGGIDDVAYDVGDEDPTFSRHLYRREFGLTTAACRRELSSILVDPAGTTGASRGATGAGTGTRSIAARLAASCRRPIIRVMQLDADGPQWSSLAAAPGPRSKGLATPAWPIVARLAAWPSARRSRVPASLPWSG